MAANQDDDDDGMFGDFAFASNHNAAANTASQDDDDDWGDFVATTSPNHISANSQPWRNQNPSSQTSNDLDFDFDFDFASLYNTSTTKPQPPPPPTIIESNSPTTAFEFNPHPHPYPPSSNNLFQSSTNHRDPQPKPSQNLILNSNSKSWEKPRGAIPLSIFGDEEEEEEEEDDEQVKEKDESNTPGNGVEAAQGFFNSKSLPTISKGSNIRSSVSFSDIVVNLYDQQPPLSRSISNVLELSNGDTHPQFKFDITEDLFQNNEPVNTSNLNFNWDDSQHGKGKPFENGSKPSAIEDLYGETQPVKLENGPTSEQIRAENGSNWNVVDDSNSKSKQVDPENGFNSNLIQENGDLDEDEWEFKDAASEKSGKDGDFDVKKDDNSLDSWDIHADLPSQAAIKTVMDGTSPKPNETRIQGSADGSLFGFSNTAQLDGDWFVIPETNSHSPTVIDNGFHPGPVVSTANVWNPESLNQPNITTENGNSTDLFNGSFGSDESFGDFKDASQTEASNSFAQMKEELKTADQADDKIKEQSVKDEVQGNGEVQENGRGALPLSIFSDGNLENDEQLFDNGMFSFNPDASLRNGINSQVSSSNLSLNDLIKDLYTRVENVPALGSSSEHTEEFISPHTDNQFIPPQTGMNSSSADMEDDFDETSWEFKAAFTETEVVNSSSVVSLGNTHENISSESRIMSFVDFYSRLKEKAGSTILHHLDVLKNVKKEAALSGEDAKVEALNKEIQMAYKKLIDENMVPQDNNLKEHKPKNVGVNGLLAAMEEPNFQVIESEYHLSQRISLAEQNLSSAVWLFEHAISVVKILNIGSVEDISNYSTTWSRMTSVCSRELKHGVSIWKQSLEKNVHKQMLTEPQGMRYILALGEIYRVAEVLRISATLYKPWILSSLTEPLDIFAQLEECRLVWSNGISEAIQSLSDEVDIGYDGSIKTLLESIKCIHYLDVLSLQSEVSRPEETCRLSLLSSKTIPGMKMVSWNGESYFLTLANFWANLVSPDPPKLRQIPVYS